MAEKDLGSGLLQRGGGSLDFLSGCEEVEDRQAAGEVRFCKIIGGGPQPETAVAGLQVAGEREQLICFV